MPKEDKANESKFALRMFQIQKWLMAGWSTPEIINYVTDKANWTDSTYWDIKESAIRNVIRKAKIQFHEDLREDFEYERTQAVTRLTRLYRSCVERGKVKDALSVQQELSKLLGLYNNDGTATGEVKDSKTVISWE